MGISREGWRRIAIGFLVLLYLVAGIAHIRRPGFFLPVVPDWVPFPRETVLATGLCELAGAIGLLWPPTRRLAAIMLALYAVCVFPANIKHAWLDLTGQRPHPLGWWYHGPRMIAQPLLVWVTLFAGGILGARRRVGT